MKKILLGIALATAAVGTVSAADLARQPVYKAAPAVALYNWTGFYVGGNAGGKWGDFSGSESIAPVAGVTPGGILPFASATDSSFVGGGQIGYNWQTGPWVFGLEGDFDGTSLKRNVVAPVGVALPFLVNDAVAYKNDWQASIRGRLGYAWDRWMLYATGGFAWANVKASAAFGPAGIVPGLVASASDTVTGGTVGVGLEYGLTQNVSLGAEYRYTDYGHANFNFGLLPITLAVASPLAAKADLSTNEVTARLNFRF